ncbi:MAG: type II toxin-antitoxin system RelE/ParE family toxin [Terriglobia bacterium]
MNIESAICNFPRRAADLVEQIVLSVERLLRFPKMGSVVPEVQDENIRELLPQNYRIIYRIAGERIEILAIVHSSRNLGRTGQ